MNRLPLIAFVAATFAAGCGSAPKPASRLASSQQNRFGRDEGVSLLGAPAGAAGHGLADERLRPHRREDPRGVR